MLEIGSEEARKRLPELLDQAHDGRPAIITKRGVAYAALVPLDQRIDPNVPGRLLPLRGSGSGLWDKDIVKTVSSYRDEWDD